jgi:hypothetical protein
VPLDLSLTNDAGTRSQKAKQLAVAWAAVDLSAGTVEVRGTVIRVNGRGLMIKPHAEDQSRISHACTPVMGGRDSQAESAGQAGLDGVLFGG